MNNTKCLGLILTFSFVAPLVVAMETGTSMDDIKKIEKAHVAVDELKNKFRQALTKAVHEKGSKGAIGDCKITAPKTPSGLKIDARSLEVGRTSHKLRNQSNAPREWVKPYLEKFSAMKPADIPKSTLVPIANDHVGYLEPLFVEPVCLNCHGSNLARGVKEELSTLYPGDRATGFNVGDFRGLVWLEWKTSK